MSPRWLLTFHYYFKYLFVWFSHTSFYLTTTGHWLWWFQELPGTQETMTLTDGVIGFSEAFLQTTIEGVGWWIFFVLRWPECGRCFNGKAQDTNENQFLSSHSARPENSPQNVFSLSFSGWEWQVQFRNWGNWMRVVMITRWNKLRLSICLSRCPTTSPLTWHAE